MKWTTWFDHYDHFFIKRDYIAEAIIPTLAETFPVILTLASRRKCDQPRSLQGSRDPKGPSWCQLSIYSRYRPPSLHSLFPPISLYATPLTLNSHVHFLPPFLYFSCNNDYQATVNWQSDKFEVPATTVKTVKASPSTHGHLDDNAIKAKQAEHAKEKYANLTSKLYAPTHVRLLIFWLFVRSSVFYCLWWQLTMILLLRVFNFIILLDIFCCCRFDWLMILELTGGPILTHPYCWVINLP